MNFEDVAEIAGELTGLKYFPTDDAGRLGIMKLIGRMASDPDQVRWLVNRMLALFDEWPGPRTMRKVFCHKFKPLDGIDISGPCEQYPDGIPDEKQIEAPALPRLPPGHQYTADAKLEIKIEQAVILMPAMPRIPRTPPVAADGSFEQFLEDTITAPVDRTPRQPLGPVNPDYKPITREQIEEAVREYRREKQKQQEPPQES